MGEWRYSSPFLTSAIDCAEWSDSYPPAYCRGNRPRIHWIGDYVHQRLSKSCGEEKNVALAGNQTPAVQPASRRYARQYVTSSQYQCS
jgi:hypothetical protein